MHKQKNILPVITSYSIHYTKLYEAAVIRNQVFTLGGRRERWRAFPCRCFAQQPGQDSHAGRLPVCEVAMSCHAGKRARSCEVAQIAPVEPGTSCQVLHTGKGRLQAGGNDALGAGLSYNFV